jgi:hydrogenase large subunit
MAGDPLITSLFQAEGSNTWLRQFVRLHRPVSTRANAAHIFELLDRLDEPTLISAEPKADADGYGFINASRGSLGHWVRVRNAKIANYQVITPTT